MPKFSVVMPTYNRAAFLERAVSSALTQTYTDFELIVVDDGSTDNTLDVLDRLSDRDSRIKVIEQDNTGPAAARNAGIARAMGHIISYLDSDNTWYPDYLSVVDEELERPYVAAYTGQNLFLIGGTLDNQRVLGRKTRSAEFNPTMFQRINLIDIGCFSHRADVMETTGAFDPKQGWGEDWDLIARIAMHFPYYVKHMNGHCRPCRK